MGTSAHDKPCGSVVSDNGQEREDERIALTRKKRVTPLPMNQLFPMTFVLLNESICSTMLLPFVGLLVSHLKGISVNEAGYYSGMLIGVFMLGQVVSSKLWGWMSDKYGRRFPLISGLFTSGLMMLGFGLSTSVSMCAIFRFLHGLFNGNVLVAKTMMSDITDKTNAAKGFAFVSLCYGIGVLIGPTLGGVLYDPAHSSALRWAHVSKESAFSRYPALLPSLVMFIYTNIGMVVCTFFVMESNPKAQPLPMLLRYIYPCFWREPQMFVHPSLSVNKNKEIPTTSTNSDDADDSPRDDAQRSDMGSIEAAELLVRNVSFTRAVASLTVASPVLHEDPRVDRLVIAETLSFATDWPLGSNLHSEHPQPHHNRCSLPMCDDSQDRNCAGLSRSVQPSSPPLRTSALSNDTSDRLRHSDHPDAIKDTPDDDGHLIVVDTESGGGGEKALRRINDEHLQLPEGSQGDGEEKRFGYKQALQRPVTRAMLLLYMLLSAADMAVQEIVPLWAIANVDKGGLGFGADKVSYIIFTNSVPCVASNLLFHKACSRYVNKLGLFRIAVMGCGLSITVLPLTSYFIHSGLIFPAVVLCTSVRQFFASWGYGLVTMLTAQSAPPQHVGSIMGINQSCGASVRALIPFLVTPLFAWSITSGNSFPLDHVFIFFLSALTFASSYAYSVLLRTTEDNVLVMADHQWKMLAAVKHFLYGSSQPVHDSG